MPFNIYDIPKVINLTLEGIPSGGAQTLSNYNFTRADFTINLGVKNIISVFIKDIDKQKVVISTGQSLAINIVDYNSQTLLLTRQLTLVDASQGLYSFIITALDSLTWVQGPLSYSVMLIDTDGSQSLLWVDQNYSPFGYCNVMPGPIPGPVPPITLDTSNFVITDGWATSQNLPGSVFPNGSQTFAFYMTAFMGPIYIQGSLQMQPQDMSDWFQIQTVNIATVTTGVSAVTITGNYVWLRVQVPVSEFILNPVTIMPVFTGVINQVVYKN